MGEIRLNKEGVDDDDFMFPSEKFRLNYKNHEA